MGHYTYFAHEIDGRLQYAWYRRLLGCYLEVCTRSLLRIELIGETPLPKQAGQMLEQMIREDEWFCDDKEPAIRSSRG